MTFIDTSTLVIAGGSFMGKKLLQKLCQKNQKSKLLYFSSNKPGINFRSTKFDADEIWDSSNYNNANVLIIWNYTTIKNSARPLFDSHPIFERF